MRAGYRDYGYHSELSSCAHGYVLPHLRRMLAGCKGSVLDLGCGNGALTRALLSDGIDIYGLDPSVSGIEIANREAPGRFLVWDVAAESLPAQWVGKRFDMVLSTEVIEHLYAPRTLLAFARNVLAGQGELILSTPYHGYLKNLALALGGRLDRHFTVLWNGGHIKFFSRATLGQMLREEGFEVTDFAGAGRLPLLWKSMIVKARVVG